MRHRIAKPEDSEIHGTLDHQLIKDQRQTQVRLKPLLIIRQIPPKGGTPASETPRLLSVPEYLSFDARPRADSFRLRRTSF